MHELSLCIALLDEVQQIAYERNAVKVTQIVVRMGPLSGVEAPLLRHAYPLAAAGTLAEDAELVIDVAAVKVRCSQCGTESEVPANRLVCRSCGDFRTNVISGDDLLLARVELETPGESRDNDGTKDEQRHIGTQGSLR